jgi:hypothetical protein
LLRHKCRRNSGSETVSYQWNRGGASAGTGVTLIPAQAGSYTVTASAAGYQSKTSAAVAVTGADIIPNTLPGITATDGGVKLLETIAKFNGNINTVHNINESSARNTLTVNSNGYISLLHQYRAQADALETFFNGAKSSYPSISEFSTLAAKEAAIKTALNGGAVGAAAVKDRPAAVAGIADEILDTIFGNSGNDRDAFDAYFNVYAQGQYLISTDWWTRNDGNNGLNTAVSDFNAARSSISDSDLPGQGVGSWDNNRGTGLAIGEKNAVNAQFTYMQNKMADLIVSKLGITGDSTLMTNAQNMAKALVIQLGQDQQEFAAFIKDLQEEDQNYNSSSHKFDNVLNSTAAIAGISTQSNIRLAGINPENTFAPELVKTAYGKPFDQYSGNFTPYRKDDDRVALA